MNNIKLLRHGTSTRAYNPGAPLSPPPAPVPPLGPEWFTQGWAESTAPLDERCEELLRQIKRSWSRVRDFSDPLGTVFMELDLGQRLPVALWQAVLRIPDEFAHGRIVLRKVKSGDAFLLRVCDTHGETVGMVEPATELLDLDWWLERCAHWLFACHRVSPEMIRATLERHLP